VIEGEQRHSGGLGEAVRGDIAAIVMAIVGHVDFLLWRRETDTIFPFSPCCRVLPCLAKYLAILLSVAKSLGNIAESCQVTQKYCRVLPSVATCRQVTWEYCRVFPSDMTILPSNSLILPCDLAKNSAKLVFGSCWKNQSEEKRENVCNVRSLRMPLRLCLPAFAAGGHTLRNHDYP
jgi:hypothetical protein